MNATKNTASRKRVPPQKADASDQALVVALNRLKETVDPAEIRQLSEQIERIVFHQQFKNA